MEPYQALANAIIKQAVADHKRAVKFLKHNRHTKKLDVVVDRQIKERKARIRKRCAEGLHPVAEGKTAEEILLNRILVCEALVEDTEEFFLSDWFSDLTDLNGAWLLEELRKMEGD